MKEKHTQHRLNWHLGLYFYLKNLRNDHLLHPLCQYREIFLVAYFQILFSRMLKGFQGYINHLPRKVLKEILRAILNKDQSCLHQSKIIQYEQQQQLLNLFRIVIKALHLMLHLKCQKQHHIHIKFYLERFQLDQLKLQLDRQLTNLLSLKQVRNIFMHLHFPLKRIILRVIRMISLNS